MLEPFIPMRHDKAGTKFPVPTDAPLVSTHVRSSDTEPQGPGSLLPEEYTTDPDGNALVHLLHVEHMERVHGFTGTPTEVVIQRLDDAAVS